MRGRDLLKAWPCRPVVALVLTVASSLLPAGAAPADTLPAGRGMLLPLVDRVGDPAAVALVEEALRSRLPAERVLIEPTDLRRILRRWRVRDLIDTRPLILSRLADELGVSWFLTVTLHEASAGPPPRVTLSGRAFAAGESTVHWAGFRAASGLDEKGWLGIGGTESLSELADEVVGRLIGPLLEPGPEFEPRKTRRGARQAAYLAEPLGPTGSMRIAVVPFDSVSDRNQLAGAEMITHAALAVLHDSGAPIVVPGLVTEIQRKGGRLSRGEVDLRVLERLRQQGGADWILTGTVETFDAGAGELPDPWIAFSARLIEVESGKIGWVDGQERRGRDSEALFGRGRLHSAGALALDMVKYMLETVFESGRRETSRRQG